jgi:hypothetical protein
LTNEVFNLSENIPDYKPKYYREKKREKVGEETEEEKMEKLLNDGNVWSRKEREELNNLF